MNACPGRKGLALGLLALAFARQAYARAPLPVSVEREPGAEDCPDTAGLGAQVQAILGTDRSAALTPYRVTFKHSAQTYVAAIRLSSNAADAAGGSDALLSAPVRRLEAREPNCTALAHATAIALAVLFDSDLDVSDSTPAAAKTSAPSEPAPAPVQAPAPSKPPAASARTDAENAQPVSATASSRTTRIDPVLALGGAALVGVLRPLGFGLVADLGLESARFRGTLGALWLPTETLDLAPGSARESLLSGTVRGCYALARKGTLRFDGCTGAFVGVARARASGFTLNQPEQRELFLAFPAELALSGRARFIGWQLGAAALLLVPPNEFKVEGLGVTYHPAPVAGMFTLRVFVEPPH